MRLVLSLAVLCLPLLAAPTFADCVDEIRAVMGGLEQAGPQRLVSTIQTKAGTTFAVSEKVPGAMHSLSQSDGVVTEYTVVGDRAWWKNGGKWAELPAETAVGLVAAVSADSAKVFENISDAECLGTETGGFVTSYRLTYRQGDAIVRASVETGSQSGLPRRVATWNSVGGEKSIAVTEFTYDRTITVTAPF